MQRYELSEEDAATPEDIRFGFWLFMLTFGFGGAITTIVLKVVN